MINISMLVIGVLHSKFSCLFFCKYRFYVGRKAMFDSDFKGGKL